MALRSTFAFACMTCMAALASAGTPKFVDLPADDLTDAVELLAKQYEVDVIYPSDLLKGRESQRINGAFEAVDAFRKLLESTPLVLSKEGDALLITQSPGASQQATTRDSADELPEVLIEAWRGAADTADQPIRKREPIREPIFGWARHNAERQARTRTPALDSMCQRLARMGDKKIQVYCIVHANPHRPRAVRTARAPEAPTGDTSCRRLIKPGNNGIQSVCGDRARWEEFDTWAVNAGVTCRLAGTSQELCLTLAQWNNLARPLVNSAAGSNWPTDGINNAGSPAYATSYGYFPQGTSIGATTGVAPSH
jgi:hypothetical protein